MKTTDKINILDIQKLRLYNNGLLKLFDSIENCIESLVGIQSQYQTYAFISVFYRTNLSITQLYSSSQIIKSWGQRATLHLYHKKDYSMISDIYKNSNNWVKKYAKKIGIHYFEYLDAITIYFQNHIGCVLDKQEIQQIIPSYKSKEIMEWSGLLILATYYKILYGIVNEEDKKIYKQNDIIVNTNTKSSFIQRYFTFYGPATKEDFLHWSGLKFYEIKDELNNYLEKINFFMFHNKKYYYANILPNIQELEIDYPILLGKFDPLLVSYYDKEWILNGFNKSVIWKKAGQIEGVILFEKGLKGTWHYELKRKAIVFHVVELKKITQVEKRTLEKKFKTLCKQFFNREFNIIYSKI